MTLEVGAGVALAILVLAGVLWWLRSRAPAQPVNAPSGFGPAGLDAAATLALLEPTALLSCLGRPRATPAWRGLVDGLETLWFDLHCTGIGDERSLSVALLRHDEQGLRIPAFSLRPRQRVQARPELATGDEVDLPAPLDERYRLSAPAQGDVKLFFSEQVREALAEASPLWLEAAPGLLAVLTEANPDDDGSTLLGLASEGLRVVRLG